MMKKVTKRVLAALLAASFGGTMAAMMPVGVSAANGLGTYEAETMEDVDQVWTSIYENEIPGYSGDGFAYLTSNPISIDIEVEEEGMYQVDVRAAQILSEEGRMQTLSVNGIDYTYEMPYLTEWTDVTFGVFRMKEGKNTLTLKPMYGYAAYDTITISKAQLPEVKATDTPVDPKATPETKALMKYLVSEYGQHILSGQQEIYGGGHGVQTDIRYDASSDTCVDGNGKEYTIDKDSYDTDEQGNKFPWHCMDETDFVYTYNTQNHIYAYNDYDTECRYLYELTGHYPAIRGFDFNCHNPGFAWEDGVTDRMISWAKDKNGICTASWHCTVPTSMDDFEIDKDGNITKISNDWQKFTYSEKTDFMPSNVMIEGTKENVFYNEAIKLVAAELQRLQDEGVPVIFRPLHEAEGNPAPAGSVSGSWFWWGKEGSEVYNQLWKYLYDKLTNEYGIHNLIWEQNLYAWSAKSADWYTGDEYVDIVGFDKYNTVYNRHDGLTSGPNEDAESKIFWSLVDFVKNGKMVSMPENSTIPSIDNMVIEQAKWSYFCTWYDDGDKFISGEEYQNADTVKDIFQSDYCITLDELPANLYTFDGESVPQETKETTEPKETEDTTAAEDTTAEDTAAEDTTAEDTTADTAETPDSYVCGDVNLDGSVDIMDVILLNKFLLGSESLTETQQAAADVDLNKTVDSTDSLNILKKVVEIIDTLPIGAPDAEITDPTNAVVLD